MLTFGSLGLLIYGLPLILAFSIAALILHAIKAERSALPVCLGSLIGLCFGAFFAASDMQDEWPLFLGCFVSGAICGWIYWRIALRKQADDADLLHQKAM
ncbi:hypothetical protein MHY87_17180 [Microvirga sp. ACRRW]|nr:hypothetical protein [Microvirga sp. ACRRW]